MTEVETYDWGFTYLCPACRTWASYHCPAELPDRISIQDGKLLFEFHCDCKEVLTITMDIE